MLSLVEGSRNDGLPTTVSEMLVDSRDPFEKALGYLAMIDSARIQNENTIAPVSLEAAASIIREPLKQMPFTIALRAGQLCWHLIDKLSLVLSFPIQIPQPPSIQHINLFRTEVLVNLMPGRDLVSDAVRRSGNFHCANLFKDQVIDA